jgi:NAD-dependent SIR2 family protein deacetylase
MKSVRKALRDGELIKDTYERLTCARCEKTVKTENDPDELHAIKICPECDRRWKQIG